MELGDPVDVHTVYIMASIKYIYIEPLVYLYSANIVLMFTFTYTEYNSQDLFR